MQDLSTLVFQRFFEQLLPRQKINKKVLPLEREEKPKKEIFDRRELCCRSLTNHFTKLLVVILLPLWLTCS